MDLIHEWDYLVDLFGKPETVVGMSGKYSNLDVDSNDNAVYIAQYPDMQISLHLDYFGRVPRRELEVYTSRDVIVGDLINSKVKFLKENKEINFEQARDSYQKLELEHFLDMIEGKKQNTNTVKQAVEVIKIANCGVRI